MAHYRLYFLNAAGRSFRSLDLDCADDAAAVTRAAHYARGRAMELWAGARVVKAYPARSGAPSAEA